jgi:hypothetical protein
VDLTGWTLRDRAGHVYRFRYIRLGPGHSVTVHTGKGDNRSGQRYWGQGYYVWNNDGDRATLRSGSFRADRLVQVGRRGRHHGLLTGRAPQCARPEGKFLAWHLPRLGVNWPTPGASSPWAFLSLLRVAVLHGPARQRSG